MPIEKYIGIIISIVSLILLMALLFRKREPFFNLREIFKEHFMLFVKCKS